jgi:hypothetical protein
MADVSRRNRIEETVSIVRQEINSAVASLSLAEYDEVLFKLREEISTRMECRRPAWHAPTLDERHIMSSAAARWTSIENIPCGSVIQIREVGAGHFQVRSARP